MGRTILDNVVLYYIERTELQKIREARAKGEGTPQDNDRLQTQTKRKLRRIQESLDNDGGHTLTDVIDIAVIRERRAVSIED